VSSAHNEVVPHINIRWPRLQPGKFAIGRQKDFCDTIGTFRPSRDV
jgi:hypothetical protein